MPETTATDAQRVHEIVRDRLQADGQLYTSGRRELVERLARTDRPVTVPELLAERPAASLSSTYRNLAVLEAVGVVARIVSGEHARFELAEEVRGDHHHHLICSACGRVEDFTVPDDLERSLSRALGRAARTSGFVASEHRLDLVGRCADCESAAPRRSSRRG